MEYKRNGSEDLSSTLDPLARDRGHVVIHAPPPATLSKTLSSEADSVEKMQSERADARQPSVPARPPIAVVGIGCRMPGGVNSPKAFWEALVRGDDMISQIPADRWSLESFHDPDQSNHSKMITKRCGFIQGIDKFDNTFFKISPREASAMDPQQRHILEVTYEAFQDGGIVPGTLGESCGVYIGVGTADYTVMLAETSLTGPYSSTGSAHSSVANRISYAFDLRGPSLVVETACASSLTALHLACEALWTGECTTALAGGCNVLLIPEITVGFSALGVLSPEGKCRPFAEGASGYVRSEGFGAFVLKPLRAALDGGDHVYAVLRGSAIAANGASKSLTMPSGPAQEAVMRAAYRRSGVPMSSVRYVEAHGTGTPVGDPIEAEAIGGVFGRPAGDSPVRIGSVKGNFGHNECAAGITSSIKAALMLDKRTLVPTANHDAPNPSIDLEGLNLRVQTATESMEPGREPFTIGLNGFGFSGAVAHLIFQEAPLRVEETAGRSAAGWRFGEGEDGTAGRPLVLPLSAKSTDALRDLAESWSRFEHGEGDALGVVSWQATRREHHPCRLVVVADSAASCRQSLEAFLEGAAPENVVTGTAPRGKPTVCFVFPGQGQQWVNMGRNLYRSQRVFREAIDECDAVFKGLSGLSLMDQCGLFGGNATTPEDSPYSSAAEALGRVEVTCPAITFIQVALLRLWASLGVRPDAVVGHSVGEVAAAHASGGLTLEEAVSVIFHRSREQAKLGSAGRMLALRAGREQAAKICQENGGLHIAALNAPGSVTLAGDADAVSAMVQNNPGKARQLRVTSAYHTAEMDPIRTPFETAMAGVMTSPPGQRSVPFYSAVTGGRHDGSLGTEYWWRNIRDPVLFQPSVEAVMRETKADIFLEIAASNTLLTSVKQIAHALDVKTPPVVVNSGLREKDDLFTMQRAVGLLYTSGVSLDWAELTERAAEWAPVPTYPWQRQSFWMETDERRRRRLGLDDRTFSGQNGRLTLELFPFLADHLVGNRVVFPAAGYVEFMIQMAVPGTEAPALKSVNFTRVLHWPDEAADPVKHRALTLALVRDGASVKVTCAGNQHCDAVLGTTSRPSDDSPFPLRDAYERCSTEVSRELFYSRLAEVGLRYGPGFRTVEKILVGDGEALAFLAPITDANQRIQIAHLDAGFQLALAAAGPLGAMYLPTRIDSLQMTAASLPRGERILAYTKVHELDSTVLGADIAMLTLDGRLLAEVRGFVARNFGSGSRSDAALPQSGVYLTEWQPTSAGTLSTSVLSEAFQLDTLRHVCGKELDRISQAQGVLAELEGVCVSYIKEALGNVSPQNLPGGDMNANIATLKSMSVKSNIKHVPYNQISDALRNVLDRAPALEAEVEYMQRFGHALPDILQMPPNEESVWYSEDGIAGYAYASASASLYRKATSQAVVQAVREAAKSKAVVRVLEVGGKTGLLTEMILEPLGGTGLADQLEYVFTEGSKKLLQQAQGNLSRYQFIDFKQLDVTRATAEKDLVPNSFDVVICAHALGAADNLEESASYIRNLVSLNGLMFVMESTDANFLAAFFSIPTGAKHTLLSRQAWADLMIKIGLEDIVSASAPQDLFESALVGRKTSMTRGSQTADDKVLIVQDNSDSFAPTFARLFEGEVETCGLSAVKSLGRILADRRGPPMEVVYAHPGRDGKLHSLLGLIQATESSPQSVKRLWVLTAGGNGDCPDPDAAPAVGLTRAAANHIPNVPIFSVDFEPGSSAEDRVRELLKLVSQEPGERELAIRDGERRVPRLVRRDLQRIATESVQAESKNWRVEQDPEDRGGSVKGASIDHLSFRVVPDFAVPPGHVRIAVKAAPLNFKDVMMALGLLEGLESDARPYFGLECAGEVVEVGSCVSGLAVRDEVVAFGESCLASHAVCDARLTVRRPLDLDWPDSAGVGVAFATAYLSLAERAGLRSGETVLIHSACGGVGLAAIQVARARGAMIICTAGSEEKRSYLRRALGVDMVSDSRSSRFREDVLRWTGGRGVDVVLNSLAGNLLQVGLSLLSPGGRFCEIGKRDILEGSSLPMDFFLENKTFHSCQLDVLMRQRPKEVGSLMRKVFSLFEEGTLTPIPTSVYSIGTLRDTFRLMAKGSHIGKIVFDVPAGFRPKDPKPPLWRCRPDATYIVTGGHGGIGQALSRWLCLNGARHLALVSRRGASTAAAKRTLHFLGKNKVSAHEFSLDISKRASVEALLEKLRGDERVPPIRGIFHLAGVIEEENLSEVTYEQMSRILGAKATGAKILHELTKQDDLDIFFMLSSITTTWGNPSQPIYCAANAYLDALAEKRQRSGLPALSIQLAPVKGAGYLEDKGETVKILTAKGHRYIHVDEFLQMLGQLLPRRDLSIVTLTNQEWSKTKNVCHGAMLKFRHLATRDKTTAEAPRLEPADADGAIKSKMADLLCMSEDAIDVSQPMVNYGVDSLVALEMVHWASGQLGMEVSQLEILGGMTTAELVERANRA